MRSDNPEWLDIALGNKPMPERERIETGLPPIDPAARVTYRKCHPTSWVAYIGNQAIDESTSVKDLLARLRSRGCDSAERDWLTLARF
jgi:hypothetical protein